MIFTGLCDFGHTRVSCHKSLAWPRRLSQVTGVAKKAVTSHWRGQEGCHKSLAWPRRLSQVTGVAKKAVTSHWRGQEGCHKSLAWPRRLSQVTGVAKKAVTRHWRGQEGCFFKYVFDVQNFHISFGIPKFSRRGCLFIGNRFKPTFIH